ncbi:MAG TPA: hypothetical protein VLH15_08705 [Dehalococcoidales bacterium]|nr:hypothetical protein [Dehalococcoidales bacterium]
MPLRYCYPPHPVGFVPREILRGYLAGDDPVSYRPLMQEIIEALTRPLTEEELNPVIEKKPHRPRLLAPDSEANLNRLFLENGWTDGLPIVLPTEERVAEMLTGTDHDPQEIVGRMSVTTHEERLEYTVEKVAVNAVMAGARPEHFPVILALAASQIPSLPSSTTSFGSMMVVNGPIRQEIGMNCGTGALSPFNFANAVIGRAWTLLSLNFGDAKINENFTASTGNNFNYNNLCCAENEELSVFEPFHTTKGFKAGDNAVSLFRGWTVMGMGLGPAKRMAEVMKAGRGMIGGATFIIDPLVAKSLKNEGFKTRLEVTQFMANEVKSPWMKPENINLIVVGGEWNPMWLTTDYFHTATVSIDKWIPLKGITLDARPLRMPAPAVCSDGMCGLPGKG